MATAIRPETKVAKVTRTGTLTILDGRHPEPLSFNPTTDFEQIETKVNEYKEQGFLVAVDDVVVDRPITPDDLNLTVAAPLVGG